MKKLFLLTAALALAAVPVFAAVPAAPQTSTNSHIIQAQATTTTAKKHVKKAHGKKSHKKGKKTAGKKTVASKPEDAGKTSAGDTLPAAPVTDNSAGPQ